MLTQIQGLHHVTSMASDARANNAFFTDTLGLRRVKKTVNFDAPEVYHLYYGDEHGTPGSVMTYFPVSEHRRPAQGRRRGRADRLRGAEGRAAVLARAPRRAGRGRARRGRELRREAAELRRPGWRRVRARRDRGRPGALDRRRRSGRGGDPRLPRRGAAAARRGRDGGAAALHGLRGGGEGRRGDPLPAAERQRRRRGRPRDAAGRAARRPRRRVGPPHRLRGTRPGVAARGAGRRSSTPATR